MPKTRLILCLTVAALLCATGEAYGQKGRTASKVKNEQKENAQQIKQTQKRLNENARTTRDQLDNLNRITYEIGVAGSNITLIGERLDSLEAEIALVGDSIAIAQQRIENLKQDYATALRNERKSRGRLNAFTFVFSARSFKDAYHRINYLRRLKKWRKDKVREVRAAKETLEKREASLALLQQEQSTTLQEMQVAQNVLHQKQQQTSEIVQQLKQDKNALQAELSRRQKRARQLEKELDRILAQELERQRAEQKAREEAERKAREEAERKAREEAAKKAATDSTSAKQPAKPAPAPVKTTPKDTPAAAGDFAAQKGRLIWPVTGTHSVIGAFGRNAHETLSNIEVENSGIDILASAGSSARAVHDGVVSSIFYLDGYGSVVIVRHGDYLTVYAGVENPVVSKGTKVSRGSNLGHVAKDADDRYVLHFEVRKEKTKLDPQQWLSR